MSATDDLLLQLAQSGVDETQLLEQFRAAKQQAEAQAPAPVLPDPHFTPEEWTAFLQVMALPSEAGDPLELCLAVKRALKASDGPAAWTALVEVWRRILKTKPELEWVE